MAIQDEALLPARLVYHPQGEHLDENRGFQGIPGIERSKGGRFFAAYYAGTKDEGNGNFVLLLTSEGDGEPFSIAMAIDPPTENTRCFDPCLWLDPLGRLWLFYAQSFGHHDGRAGVWALICEKPDGELVFSAPRCIANGVMMNKPIVTKSGDWLLPCSVWSFLTDRVSYLPEEGYSNVYRSQNQGMSFELIGHSDWPERFIDEHVLVEKQNGDIWMLIRGKKGIGQAVSADGGVTWSAANNSQLGGPCARFACRRLKSGRLILVNHAMTGIRNNLMVFLSEDDGISWKGFFMLDERNNVSYPDLTEDENGNIYIIYDYERYRDREIYLARLTEADILAGHMVTAGSHMGRVISKAYGSMESL